MNMMILIPGLIGLLIGGPFGMLIGAGLGYWFSRNIRLSVLRMGANLQQMQQGFLDATFAVMGAMCKADGVVTQDEIQVAEALFERLRLGPDARDAARKAFNRGKAPGFDLDAEVARFLRISGGNRALVQMFLQVQVSAMAADGRVHDAEQALLRRVARGLGLSDAELAQIEAMLRGGASRGGPPTADALADAYKALGINQSASDAELKKAYRKLMSEHHPDKLAAKGLPESMRAMAEEKTREITGAYDLIKTARGLS